MVRFSPYSEVWNFSKVPDEGSESRYWHNLVTNCIYSGNLGVGIENIFTYSLCLMNGKPSSQLNWWHRWNCLGQRGQIKLFSDFVYAALFWDNFNPNTRNSFKLIFFIFDLLHCSIYQRGLLYHYTKVWYFCIACCALLPRSIQAELALVLLLFWTWAHKVMRTRQVFYGNLFIYLI